VEKKKYCRTGKAAVDNVVHAHFTLGNEGYKHTLSEYVIVIAFLLKQWLHERATLLRYAYIACLVIFAADKLDMWKFYRSSLQSYNIVPIFIDSRFAA